MNDDEYTDLSFLVNVMTILYRSQGYSVIIDHYQCQHGP